VTDPKGTATPTAGDYTTIYTYDTLGQLNRATDANGHHTDYSGYDLTGDLAVGYPKTITDHLQKSTSVVYDARRSYRCQAGGLRRWLRGLPCSSG
jgi:YD repeat-containing protein